MFPWQELRNVSSVSTRGTITGFSCWAIVSKKLFSSYFNPGPIRVELTIPNTTDMSDLQYVSQNDQNAFSKTIGSVELFWVPGQFSIPTPDLPIIEQIFFVCSTQADVLDKLTVPYQLC